MIANRLACVKKRWHCIISPQKWAMNTLQTTNFPLIRTKECRIFPGWILPCVGNSGVSSVPGRPDNRSNSGPIPDLTATQGLWNEHGDFTSLSNFTKDVCRKEMENAATRPNFSSPLLGSKQSFFFFWKGSKQSLFSPVFAELQPKVHDGPGEFLVIHIVRTGRFLSERSAKHPLKKQEVNHGKTSGQHH